MEALLRPLREEENLQQAQAAEKPVHIWGVERCVRAFLTQEFRGESPFALLVTYDDARAQKLAADFRFLTRDVAVYPAKDALFYYADIHGSATTTKRLEIQKKIMKQEPCVIVLTIDALMDRLPDPKYLRNYVTHLFVGQTAPQEALVKRLSMAGYANKAVVEAAGQFSVRGGIVDIFPLTEECPYRVEYFGDEVDSIRSFDVDSQRSIEVLQELEIFPATEYVLSEARKHRGLRRMEDEAEPILKNLKESFQTEAYARLRSMLDRLREDMTVFDSTTGLDSLVTYFYGSTVSFLDCLPENTPIFVDEPEKTAERAKDYHREYVTSMEGRAAAGFALPGQKEVLYSEKETREKLRGKVTFLYSDFYKKAEAFEEKSSLCLDTKAIVPFRGNTQEFLKEIRGWRDEEYRVVIVTPSQTRGRRIAKSLQEENIPAFFSESRSRTLEPREVMITTGSLAEGFRIPSAGIAVLTENELFRQGTGKAKRKKFSGEAVETLSQLTAGDYVVHERHGIGIYRGIQEVVVEGRRKDYINIEYANNGKLFIPVEQMGMIGKYAGKDMAHPKLNKLGGTEWSRTRAKVKQHVEGIAQELVDLYAMRRDKKGFAFSEDTVWQKEFEELFPYDETPDQLLAIEDTKRDMESDHIMDRLICGDVGFGKTEVAIRAAFKAVQDGKQVAYLVPTTILAEQHYETFTERMKGYPINVGKLSRFCTPKEIRENLKKLAAGELDIVIGTHRLLSKDVSFRNLGLLIIDEEQRFGVKHKETIKQMKVSVDVLTLTATPIPRTLHMSMIGVREMSLLTEAPQDRRPVQTYVMEYDREIVKEAVNREMARGGQVYYVYNRVDDIDRVALDLKAVLPDAQIETAHGRMNERELEDIMHRFIRKEIDVLVSTTIIETGLDIPNVNTIIIHNAENFGLAQLYQLRGRVGRSGRNAYAFLMYQRNKMIKEVAEKRLTAIREFTELGSGYKISMKDLELRGAGNIFGNSQSGHMEEVGYDLYVKMLSAAIRKMTGKGGDEEKEEFDTEIVLPVDAYIPDTYMKSEFLKLEMYKKIARIRNAEDADEVRSEAEDRFGRPSREFERLLSVAVLKEKAHSMHLSAVRFRDDRLQLVIRQDAPVEVARIPQYIKKKKGLVRIMEGKESGFSMKASKLIPDELLHNAEAFVDEVREAVYPEEAHEAAAEPSAPAGTKA